MDLLTLINDLILLLTKALPSDEQKLGEFKLRSPKIYARIQKSILRGIVRYARKEKFNKEATLEYCQIELADLPDSEVKLFEDLACKELGFPVDSPATK